MLSPSKILLFFLLSFIGGIFIASFFKVPRLIFYELLLLGAFYLLMALILCLWKKDQRYFSFVLGVFAICLLVFVLGVWRVQLSEARPQISEVSPQIITLLSEQAAATRPLGPTAFWWLQSLKQRFQQVVDQNLSPPQSGILSAVLLGNKYEISKEFKEKLNIAGIRHITAISGMHIVILSGILLWLGVAFGLCRGTAFYFAVVALWLFILMIGSTSSAVRAGIMGSMFLFCEKIGRQKTADRALLLTAAIMLTINPSLLRYSIGFQLSFLATLGIIYLMPLFQEVFNRLSKQRPVLCQRQRTGLCSFFIRFASHLQPLTSIIAMTLAAQVFVLPLLIYYFGQVSIISPLANLLIVPVLSYLMVAGLAFVLIGAVWQPLALVFIFPVWLLLTYIAKITEFFAGLSFSAVNFSIRWFWLFIIYSALALIVWRIKKWQRLKALP